MPGVTGILVDDQIELEAQAGLAVADLPFDGFYVADAAIGIGVPPVVDATAFQVRGTTWRPVDGSPWSLIIGREWVRVPGSPWPPIRRP